MYEVNPFQFALTDPEEEVAGEGRYKKSPSETTAARVLRTKLPSRWDDLQEISLEIGRQKTPSMERKSRRYKGLWLQNLPTNPWSWARCWLWAPLEFRGRNVFRLFAGKSWPMTNTCKCSFKHVVLCHLLKRMFANINMFNRCLASGKQAAQLSHMCNKLTSGWIHSIRIATIHTCDNSRFSA